MNDHELISTLHIGVIGVLAAFDGTGSVTPIQQAALQMLDEALQAATPAIRRHHRGAEAAAHFFHCRACGEGPPCPEGAAYARELGLLNDKEPM